MTNGAEFIRRELMIRMVRAFDEGNLEEEIDRIPIRIRPRHGAFSRSSVWHDRAVLKYRIMALLGYSCEGETDEARPLASYLAEMRRTPPSPENPLTVCSAGCDGCRPRMYMVTDNCRGCFSRPCEFNCPKKAVTVTNQHSHIDQKLCVKCGKCAQVCPYHAIVEVTVPCEEACPVGAIRKNEFGVAQIDFSKCIFCGACFRACPFSAIVEKTQLVQLLYELRDRGQTGRHFTAIVAPAAMTQFPGTIEQLFAAIKRLGFDEIVEVALGADMTTRNEAHESLEFQKEGRGLMTTSCCPAWVNLVKKHFPAFLPHVSTTPSPMVYAAGIAKELNPETKIVFIGPCIAKRDEALSKENVDYVLSFEELGAIFAARKIDPVALDPLTLPNPASDNGRNYAKSCGVTKAVLDEIADEFPPGFQLDAKFIDGLDRKAVAQIRLYTMGKLPANFLEVMACKGGCQNGPCSLHR